MKFIELEQNTPAWHEFRSTRIGASDIPAIMEESPYKSKYEAWLEKMNLMTFPTNDNMKRGELLEHKAREWVNEYLDKDFTPKMVLHPKLDFLFCSLDGMTSNCKYILEIKCNGKRTHDAVFKDANIPKSHMLQMQTQMACCELGECYYLSYVENDSPIVLIAQRNEKTIKKIEEAAEYFYYCMENFISPWEHEPKRVYELVDF